MSLRASLCFGLLSLVGLFGQTPAAPPTQMHPNVVYGMYSGLALLMDVHVPEKSNGYGVVFIAGSGWNSPQAYGASQLKAGLRGGYVQRLTQEGYTVFAVNHRAAPRFRYPAAVEDVQRAVRFVRHNASRYGIHADRIGALGSSSGAHLALLLGTMEGSGDAEDKDPVNRESAKVQCVVSIAGPGDLLKHRNSIAAISFLGMPAPGAIGMSPANRIFESIEEKTYREASPVSHVTRDDSPVLLMHGDADSVVPFLQAELMEKALKDSGVATKLLRVPGGVHGSTFGDPPNPPDYLSEMASWMKQHLRQQ